MSLELVEIQALACVYVCNHKLKLELKLKCVPQKSSPNMVELAREVQKNLVG
jgi:hypothetical protein